MAKGGRTLAEVVTEARQNLAEDKDFWSQLTPELQHPPETMNKIVGCWARSINDRAALLRHMRQRGVFGDD